MCTSLLHSVDVVVVSETDSNGEGVSAQTCTVNVDDPTSSSSHSFSSVLVSDNRSTVSDHR